MGDQIIPNMEACKTCQVGSCCYEGVDLSEKEMERIVKYKPDVAEPWFRKMRKSERIDERFPFTTLVRDGTCVFQDKNNRCLVYKVRPELCRDFPLEDGKTVPYYKKICVLFHDQWPANATIKQRLKQREKDRFF